MGISGLVIEVVVSAEVNFDLCGISVDKVGENFLNSLFILLQLVRARTIVNTLPLLIENGDGQLPKDSLDILHLVSQRLGVGLLVDISQD